MGFISASFPRELTIPWLREGYLSGAFTPADVVGEILRRVGEDRGMNIWIAPPSPESVAPYLERLRDADPAVIPLWGIPFAIKDNIDWTGAETTAGCPAYAYRPDENAAVVERLIAAGALPLGKTNLDQFATGLVGTRSPYGETHNALRPELISGGSSSGSAVAVARGHAVFALGTDTAGSGRVPAALNNLVGYKPSLGAWPVRGVVPACASLDCVSVFAHTLEDALAVDDAVRGPDARDPWSRPLPRAAARLPRRLCLPDQAPAFHGPFAEAYRAAWEQALRRLEALGVPVEYVDGGLFAEAASLLYDGPWVAERWAALGGFVEAHAEAVFPVTGQVLRSGADPRHTAAALFTAKHRLQLLKLEARRLLADAVLALPTCGGTWTREQLRANPVGANSDMGRYTNHCNLLDLCAAAIPTGFAGNGLPFGITLFGTAEQEALVCGLARLFLSENPGGAAMPLKEAAASPGTGEAVISANGQGESDGGQEISANHPVALRAPASTVAEAASPKNGVEATTRVAVCGLHMRGFPLERQMQEHGAVFLEETVTAPVYRMIKLPADPAKPGLIRVSRGGASLRLEVWEMPLREFGAFAAQIPAPLGIGKVELEDGTAVPGFICEAYASDAAGTEDITSSGGWRQLRQH
ncbi:allophanate hydrolase [Paenibacillus macerans]|uniref:allophanate hydrolase n=2 Tax=Paenibacillus macerans TaxID=44252 RepID=UPI003D2D1B4A